ncbi:MAG: hypothetical protein IKI93_06695, partial [Clostridia bacterium]|nr:hypothetical protein [Clostridia bacterium]
AEAKAMGKPETMKQMQNEQREAQIREANGRIAAAEKRIDEAKKQITPVGRTGHETCELSCFFHGNTKQKQNFNILVIQCRQKPYSPEEKHVQNPCCRRRY